MGVSGAAVSSAFSEGLAGVILIFIFFNGRYDIKFKLKEYHICRYTAFRIGFVIMSTMLFVFLFFLQYLLAIFTNDQDVILQGASVLKIEAFSQPFFASAIILSGALRGARDTRYPLFVAVFGMWIVRLSLAWVLV